MFGQLVGYETVNKAHGMLANKTGSHCNKLLTLCKLKQRNSCDRSCGRRFERINESLHTLNGRMRRHMFATERRASELATH